MADTSGKSEKPTPKRKREARKKGQIAKSVEVVTWTSVLVVSLIMELMVVHGGRTLTNIMRDMGPQVANPDIGSAVAYLSKSLAAISLSIAPFIGVLMITVLVANLAQTGLVFSSKKLKPSFKMMNPVKGFKRMFGSQGLWEAFKASAKLGVLAFVTWRTLQGFIPKLFGSGDLGIMSVVGYTGKTAVTFVRQIAIAGLVLAALDYAYNRRSIMKNLRMTKQEIIEEFKLSDGDPLIKAKRRSIAMAMSRNRMMAAVKDADAIIVNPTHVAVAIKYTPGTGAPKVVAKGIGHLAERIRDEAERHSVPLIEDIPLARTLYKVVDLDRSVPAVLFEAVAKVLAFVFALRASGRLTWGGIHKMPTPTIPLLDADQLGAIKRGKGDPIPMLT